MQQTQLPPIAQPEQLTFLDDQEVPYEQRLLTAGRYVYSRSRFLQQRYPRFEELWADNRTGLAVRISASALVRKADKRRGR
ncbi:hypothetical protein MCEMSHM24_02716 [Comamonadaceae bacterium]